MTRPLRIGLLVDEPGLDASLGGFVTSCRGNPRLDLSHLVVHAVPAPVQASRLRRLDDWVRRRGLAALAGKFVFHGLRILEQQALRRGGVRLDDGQRIPAAALGLKVLEITPRVSPSGFVYRFGDDDLERLREPGFDVLLRFGSGILRGAILAVPTFGVLSFHHGDNQVNRGGPPGYWEVQEGQDATGFIIQRLTEELDGGEVLFRGWLQTRSPFLRNQALLMRESLPSMARLLGQLARDRALPPADHALPYAFPLLRSPGVADSARYVLRQGHHWARKVARRLAGRQRRWGVSVQPRHWRDAVLWRATPVPNPPGRFLADPFLISHEGQTCLFVEDLSYASGKGDVAVYRLGPPSGGGLMPLEGSGLVPPSSGGPAPSEDSGRIRIERIGVALDEPFHLSFPFLFRWNGELYMCPETQQAHEVRVYRCVAFPLQWELASVLMKDVDIVDSMLFERGGRWWLLGNKTPAGADGSRDECFAELHAFHADHPLSQSWTPHPANPLCLDARRARNGGLLHEGDEIFRVSQRYGMDQYGVSATLFRIDRLDETGYAESPVLTMDPTFRKGLDGLHHMHSDGGWTTFDYATYERIEGH